MYVSYLFGHLAYILPIDVLRLIKIRLSFLGLFIGLGILSKYLFIYLVVGIKLLFLFYFFYYKKRKKFSFLNFFITGLVSFLIITPHLIWFVRK